MKLPSLSRCLDQLPAAGTYSVWVGPLKGQAWVDYRADSPHYAASTMKLAVVMAAYDEAAAGRVDLDGRVTVHNRHASAVEGAVYEVDGDGDADPDVWARMGTDVALRWLAYRALVRSSNLATNLVLEVVGLEPVARMLARCGAEHSVVSRGIEDGPARTAGLDNLVTAADLGRELQTLAAGDLLGEAVSRELLAVLCAQQINDAVPVGLPSSARVAHKSGWVDGCSHDAAIIYPPSADPFVFVMCTTSDLSETAGRQLIASAAAAAYADMTGQA